MMIISLFGGVVIGGCLFVSLPLLVTGTCAYVMYFLTLLEVQSHKMCASIMGDISLVLNVDNQIIAHCLGSMIL